ncbi:NusG domain II-containing protein [uncultured Abyssibacter sp.]|uniref:NusG domain II-containing protein n=1 Tax=uncultured Abyssibacter sp. TaxID=2320202 RepID=UPI0032B196A7
MTGPRPTPADVVLIAVLALVIGGLYARFWAPTAAAPTHALVKVDDAEPLRIPLHVDDRLVVTGRLGDSELEVSRGRIRFLRSPCRHKVCIRSGWLHDAHDATACLPNRVSVSMAASDPRYDGISQ